MKVLNINFTNVQRKILEDELRNIEYPIDNYDTYILKIREVLEKYKNFFSDAIENRNLSFDKNGYGVIKFTNLPQDYNIEIPPANYNQFNRIEKESYISENILTLIGLIFGEPYTMYKESKGLIPTKKSINEYTGEGANVDLGFHIENSALRYLAKNDCSPKCLLLTGVKQQDTPPYTPISDGRDALKLLSSEDIQILSKPLYKIKLPYRQMCSINMTEDCSTKYIPIISFQENKIIFNGAFYGDIMIYKNQEAKKAMDNFVLALKKVMLKEILTPGEMVCIDNRAVYHSRTMFDAKFDNLGRAYRWIQRLFITEDLNSFSDYDLKGKRSFTVKFD